VQACNHLDTKTEINMCQRGMYECRVTDRCAKWMYRTKSCGHVSLELRKKQFAVYIYSTVHFMKNLKTIMHNSCCVLWTWWNVWYQGPTQAEGLILSLNDRTGNVLFFALTFYSLAVISRSTKLNIQKFYMVLTLHWVFCMDFYLLQY